MVSNRLSFSEGSRGLKHVIIPCMVSWSQTGYHSLKGLVVSNRLSFSEGSRGLKQVLIL